MLISSITDLAAGAKDVVFHMVNGVFKVYLNNNNEPPTKSDLINFEYPNLEKYINDVNRMCTLVSDGSLQVIAIAF